MTTLKFIDELIYCAERNITKTNNDLELYKENNRYSEQLELQLKALENRLKYLLKVRDELKAWEIVKPTINRKCLKTYQLRILNDVYPFKNLTGLEAETIERVLEGKND